MLYPFRDNATGETVELSMPMRDAPPIGSVIEHEGRTLTRVVSDFVVANEGRGFKAFASPQLPPDMPGFKYDKKGDAIFERERDVRNFAAKSKDTPGGIGGTGSWEWNP